VIRAANIKADQLSIAGEAANGSKKVVTVVLQRSPEANV